MAILQNMNPENIAMARTDKGNQALARGDTLHTREAHTCSLAEGGDEPDNRGIQECAHDGMADNGAWGRTDGTAKGDRDVPFPHTEGT